jgi:hypothetical protein
MIPTEIPTPIIPFQFFNKIILQSHFAPKGAQFKINPCKAINVNCKLKISIPNNLHSMCNQYGDNTPV